jgi:hypothetical protein
MIDSPELSCSAESCLDFISDEENSMFFGRSSDTWPKVIRRDDSSCLTLNWLHHDRSDTDSDIFTDL